jgi:hypothetical protein
VRYSSMLLACALLLAPIAGRADESAPCRITGGGCLKLPGATGHMEASFGGNVGSLHGPWQDPPVARANTWEHVYRDGRTILSNFQSTDAHVVSCRPERSGPCPPPGGATQVEFEGTGKFNIGAGPLDEDGNFEATVVDVGTCEPGVGDFYSIKVRRGIVQGLGEVVYEASGRISCGNIRAFAPWANAAR